MDGEFEALTTSERKKGNSWARFGLEQGIDFGIRSETMLLSSPTRVNILAYCWLNDLQCQFEWSTEWLTDWLIDWVREWLIHLLIDQLIDCLTDTLTDYVIDWLISASERWLVQVVQVVQV